MRLLLLSLVATAGSAVANAEQLHVRYSGGMLRVEAVNLNFLSGKSLERLRQGASVTFDIQVSVLADSRQSVLRRSFERFLVSYDIWEERFSISRMRSSQAGAAHLTAAATQSWALDRFAMEAAQLPQNRPLWFRIDVRAADEKERRSGEDETLSLASLIELFSKSAKSDRGGQWRAESNPVIIADLMRRATSP